MDVREIPATNPYISFSGGFIVFDDGTTLPIDSYYDEDGDEIDDYESCRFIVAGRDKTWVNIDLDEYSYKPGN